MLKCEKSEILGSRTVCFASKAKINVFLVFFPDWSTRKITLILIYLLHYFLPFLAHSVSLMSIQYPSMKNMYYSMIFLVIVVTFCPYTDSFISTTPSSSNAIIDDLEINDEDKVYDMDLSDDIFQGLTGDYGDYYDDEENFDFGSVYPNQTAFRWPDGIIPYQFNESLSFECEYKRKIQDAIIFLNTNLEGCIYFRYVYIKILINFT